MSIQAIRNGLFHLLTASGPYEQSSVSACSFDPLEATNSGCAIVFQPLGVSQIEPLALGSRNARAYERRWRIGGVLYIRDTSDPQALLGKIWQGYDDLYNTISKDDSLGGACEEAHLESITNRGMEQFVELGGQLWKPIAFSVLAVEF
jgi:hypothetical protein